jgi:hypothetical protein
MTIDIAIEVNQEVLEQKKTSWSKMGEMVYTAELRLQAMAQAPLADFHLPIQIEEIPKAEEKLKELKSVKNEIEKSRKEITGKFDEVSQRLMNSEKSLNEPIQSLSNSIIELKRELEKKQALEKNKENERKSIIEKLSIMKANTETGFKTKIQNAVDKAYNHALGEGNIDPKIIEAFISTCKDGLKINHFTAVKPIIAAQFISGEEVLSLVDKTFTIDSQYFLDLYHSELTNRFSDYEIAFVNKAEALAQSEKEAIEKKAILEQEQKNKEVAAKLESSSTPLVQSGPEVKALKKSYEVEMPETVENAIALIAAFTANLSLCMPEIRVTKWFSFTPAQAAGALSRVKSKDNNFAPANIIFKEVDKL